MFGLSKRMLVVVGILAGVLAVYQFGSDRQQGDEPRPASGPGDCRVTVVADMLNVRAGPTTNAPVMEQLARDAEADAGTTVEKGFRKLGINRWAADEYLTPLPGRECE